MGNPPEATSSDWAGRACTQALITLDKRCERGSERQAEDKPGQAGAPSLSQLGPMLRQKTDMNMQKPLRVREPARSQPFAARPSSRAGKLLGACFSLVLTQFDVAPPSISGAGALL